ncbi:MAG: SPOR domain-containing protein [Pseudomonadota bacterium]
MTVTRSVLTSRSTKVAGAALLALIAVPASADVKAGVDAWSAGDYNSAVSEWQLPAQNGDADALFNLAQAYRLGRGVAADISRARELYAEAAQKGHVKAADNYGLLLFQQGEQQNAMPLIRAAAERGDPRAQYVMGLAHFNADYARKDWPRAYALLTLSQSAGLPQASAALAQMDEYIPMEQRQQAQLLAREIEAEAGKRRAAELAAVDLGQRPVSPTPVVASRAPTPVAITPAPIRPVPVAAAPRSATSRTGKWKVQLGAFGVRSNADKLWGKLAGNSALSGTSKVLVPAGRVTRLQAVGFNSRAEAQAACTALQRQGQACMVAKP